MKRKRWNLAVLVAAGTLGAMASASNGRPVSCLEGRQAALVRGHFTGAIVCSKKYASFVLVGRTAGRNFYIYDYRYRFLPAHGNVMHGGQKIVVFRNNAYVGQYPLSPPPYATVTVHGPYISLQIAGAPKVKLDLTRQPPGQMHFNGEGETFSR